MRISNKPTRGTPLTEEELKVRRNPGGKGWQAGARFVWVSHFGSSSTNVGKREVKGKGRAGATRVAVEKLTHVPHWARKYQ